MRINLYDLLHPTWTIIQWMIQTIIKTQWPNHLDTIDTYRLNIPNSLTIMYKFCTCMYFKIVLNLNFLKHRLRLTIWNWAINDNKEIEQ